ncbi:MAG: hypothetical protein AMXMBFR53_33540 [Gemmatimonadota bacterium]
MGAGLRVLQARGRGGGTEDGGGLPGGGLTRYARCLQGALRTGRPPLATQVQREDRMGKGDQRTAKGKRFRGTHGKTLPKKPQKAKAAPAKKKK